MAGTAVLGAVDGDGSVVAVEVVLDEVVDDGSVVAVVLVVDATELGAVVVDGAVADCVVVGSAVSSPLQAVNATAITIARMSGCFMG
ncbi:MAG: hypothetical protein KDB37_13800 [Ilumatobacter sp.]|nr:hypothetical protein [Ilumatobacter sp.]